MPIICSCGGTHEFKDCQEPKRVANPFRFLSELFRRKATLAWRSGDPQGGKAYDLCASELEKEWMP